MQFGWHGDHSDMHGDVGLRVLLSGDAFSLCRRRTLPPASGMPARGSVKSDAGSNG
jgi:hypothetical protein